MSVSRRAPPYTIRQNTVVILSHVLRTSATVHRGKRERFCLFTFVYTPSISRPGNVYGTKYLQRNETTEQLFNLKLLLDRFHQKGHKRPMCQRLMNPDYGQNAIIMKHVNTSICEQFFSYLTKFRFSLRSFNYPTSSIFTLLLFHLKNCNTVGINTNAFVLAEKYFPSQIKPYVFSPCVFDSVVTDGARSTNDDYHDGDEGEDGIDTDDDDDKDTSEIDA